MTAVKPTEAKQFAVAYEESTPQHTDALLKLCRWWGLFGILFPKADQVTDTVHIVSLRLRRRVEAHTDDILE